MNKNIKLGLAVSLTAIVAFSAGWVTAADHTDNRLVNALDAVGQNIFGRGNFGATLITPPDDGMPPVQIDYGLVAPPDDSIPVYLNVFHPPDPNTPTAPQCEVAAQVAVTSEGITFYTDTPGNVVFREAPFGVPPSPCFTPPPDDN